MRATKDPRERSSSMSAIYDASDWKTAAIVGYVPDLEPLLNGPSTNRLPFRQVKSVMDFGNEEWSEDDAADTWSFVPEEDEDDNPPTPPSVKEKHGFLSNMFREGSVRGSIFNLCSATLGAGALSLPYAFRLAGIIPGFIMLILGAVSTAFSIHLLIRCKNATGFVSYEDMTVGLFGRKVGILVELTIIIFCFGTMVAYIVAVGDILNVLLVVGKAPSWLSRKLIMTAFWLFIMFPLSMLEKINSLRFTSFFAVLTIFYLVFATVFHSSRTVYELGYENVWGRGMLFNPDFLSVVQAMPIVMFAFTCQVNVFSIYEELERSSAKRMAKVTHGAIYICFAVYSLMGTFGSLEFNELTQGNILKNYCLQDNVDPMVIVSYAAISSTIVMAFPLNVFPCRYTLDIMLFRNRSESKLRHTILTLLISGGALVMALFVGDINVVFQLMGGTSSASVCFVLPAAFAIKVCRQADKNENHTLVKVGSWVLVIGGIVAGLLSTGVTIYQMVVPVPEVDPCPN